MADAVYIDELDKACDFRISEIHNLQSELLKTENEILSLCRNRKDIVSIMKQDFADIIFQTYNTVVGYPYDELQNAYINESFESELVRNAVANIRQTFLDVDLETAKKIYCIALSFTYQGVEFIFSDGKIEFGIFLPASKDYQEFSEYNDTYGRIAISMRKIPSDKQLQQTDYYKAQNQFIKVFSTHRIADARAEIVKILSPEYKIDTQRIYTGTVYKTTLIDEINSIFDKHHYYNY